MPEPKPSTPDEMKKFASGFTKSEWAKLCEDKLFNILLTDNLADCRIHAEKVLAKAKKKAKKKVKVN